MRMTFPGSLTACLRFRREMRFEPHIYPITDRELTGLSHLRQARQMIEGGARVIQLRDKTADSADLFRSARDVCAFAKAKGVNLLINDRVDIALAVSADGVHLGQNDMPAEKARRILGNEALIGVSTHSLRQAAAAIELPVDYIAIGPVFPTSTKSDAQPPVSLKGVRSVRDATAGVPLVAIGGITRENYTAVLEAGADAVAAIGAILLPPEAISMNVGRFLK